MTHLFITLIVFVCVFGSALFGLYLRGVLPAHHLSDDSIGVVKLATGLIATMAALVLGLLISSAKNSFDTLNSELVHNSANVISLDRALAHYGSQAQEIRDLLKKSYGQQVQMLASGDPSQRVILGGPKAVIRAEEVQRKLEDLSPTNAEQHQLQARAIQLADEILAVRWLALLQAESSTPIPLLIALVLWLSIIFGAFGLFAPFNGTVIATLFLGALSTSGAIFLIEEMSTPLDGMIGLSIAPMHAAFALLGQ
ncbi:hypothetical protein [Paraburkholderia sp. Cpub6]|uniref:bestrophin-like domain n=1 Tax=Paraburkholderia sp. Cpub6 TaxID=2723094 RepID=UPI00160C41B1|nr:hypothetical protein [Paraburkholderia sp. Cpub6]MBB5460289.1 uncharacterized membrane protein (DUF485 family) [Paraburkholderia sp. Cpub6]